MQNLNFWTREAAATNRKSIFWHDTETSLHRNSAQKQFSVPRIWQQDMIGLMIG